MHDITPVYSLDNEREIAANRKTLAVETVEKSGNRLKKYENVNDNPGALFLQQKNNRTTKQHDTCTVYPLEYEKGDA
jgi:hypothetical protein